MKLEYRASSIKLIFIDVSKHRSIRKDDDKEIKKFCKMVLKKKEQVNKKLTLNKEKQIIEISFKTNKE